MLPIIFTAGLALADPMVIAVNSARGKLPAVKIDPVLMHGAYQSASVQSEWGLGHHLDIAPAFAENCGKGYASVQDVVNGWMASPGHRRNLLERRYTHIGWAVVYNRNGTPYWAIRFR